GGDEGGRGPRGGAGPGGHQPRRKAAPVETLAGPPSRAPAGPAPPAARIYLGPRHKRRPRNVLSATAHGREERPMTEPGWLAEQFEQNRPHLQAVAYGMLGSVSEAQDAVQEAWLRLSHSHTRPGDDLPP